MTLMSNPVVVKVVATGGECGGKTQLCQRLATLLGNMPEWEFVRIPEVATVVFGMGPRAFEDDREGFVRQQERILRMQLAVEDAWVKTLNPQKKTLIFGDRGAMDGKAFLLQEEWKTILAKVGVAEKELLEREDAVVHLVTAADGAEEHYKLEGERVQDVSMAKFRDFMLKMAYGRHPHREIFDNKVSFDEKLARAVAFIKKTMALKEAQAGLEV